MELPKIEPRAYMEDVAPMFATAIMRAAIELAAPVFANDLARGGLNGEHLRIMASRWEECDFEPLDFADDLLCLADEADKHEGALP